MYHAAGGDQRYVAAKALHVGDAERNRVLACGTGPFSWYIILSSKKTTGLSSRMALLRSPLASYGVAGTTTFNPGI